MIDILNVDIFVNVSLCFYKNRATCCMDIHKVLTVPYHWTFNLLISTIVLEGTIVLGGTISVSFL